MGMAWPWKECLQPTPYWGWRTVGWLALVRLPRPATGSAQPPPARVAPAGVPAGEPDAASFEDFFLRYEQQITNYLWRLTGNEQTACELAQETFLRAWQHFEAVRQYEQPLAWLFRVATNLARQQYRRKRAPVGRATPLDAEADLTGSDPTQHVAEQELVRQALLQLSFQQRAALILCEVYGFSCAEVGQLLHISRDAVKMALWRAREQFRVRYLRESEDTR